MGELKMMIEEGERSRTIAMGLWVFGFLDWNRKGKMRGRKKA